jgi:hypothetical protein
MVIDNPAQAPTESESFEIAQDTLAELVRHASCLPLTIHYFDDYHEVERQIRASDPDWRICLNGHTTIFKIEMIDSACRHVLHALAVVGLPSVPKGTESAISLLLAHPSLRQRTVTAALGGPLVGLAFVRTELATLAPHSGAADAARALLRAFARLAWFGWTED